MLSLRICFVDVLDNIGSVRDLVALLCPVTSEALDVAGTAVRNIFVGESTMFVDVGLSCNDAEGGGGSVITAVVHKQLNSRQGQKSLCGIRTNPSSSHCFS